jgi:hypothetical protein
MSHLEDLNLNSNLNLNLNLNLSGMDVTSIWRTAGW